MILLYTFFCNFDKKTPLVFNIAGYSIGIPLRSFMCLYIIYDSLERGCQLFILCLFSRTLSVVGRSDYVLPSVVIKNEAVGTSGAVPKSLSLAALRWDLAEKTQKILYRDVILLKLLLNYAVIWFRMVIMIGTCQVRMN